MRRALRSPIPYVALGVVAVIVVIALLSGGSHVSSISTGDFQKDLAQREVLTATVHDGADQVTGQLQGGIAYKVAYPDRYTPEIIAQIAKAVPGYKTEHPHRNPWLVVLGDVAPIVVLIVLFGFLLYSLQGGGRLAQFGKAKTKSANKDLPKVTFSDVAGADEAVAELTEIKEFLEAPSRFEALGARIPKGVLLFGPPGTGKTLLARAVAGEAGVPFFSISGSDFVEMFVGVGASRVRDLFEQAKSSAPAIVFMDEIDAVGRHRGAGLGGGHDEREQTLNQLLVEMDGFDTRQGVILIAATNRPDILDPALLRPGRFDRQIVVDRPDRGGRRKILGVHADGKPLHPTVSLDVLAKRTPGFTGADLANLLNEAALLTARRNLRKIGMRECEEAIDRVMAGPERKTLVLSEHDKAVTAYHEAGHVIVGHVLPHADPIHKVSIVARSRSLGLTFTLPDDKFNHSRSELRDSMAMCLGGRSAEELVFDEPTTGAENDIEKATRLARAMVTEFGMSDTLGPQQLAHPSAEVFLGRDVGQQATYSEEIAGVVDAEVRSLIAEAHDRARSILATHATTLEALARALIEKETLDTPELMDIIGELAPWSAPAVAGAAAPGPGRGGRRRTDVSATARTAAPAASPPGPAPVKVDRTSPRDSRSAKAAGAGRGSLPPAGKNKSRAAGGGAAGAARRAGRAAPAGGDATVARGRAGRAGPAGVDSATARRTTPAKAARSTSTTTRTTKASPTEGGRPTGRPKPPAARARRPAGPRKVAATATDEEAAAPSEGRPGVAKGALPGREGMPPRGAKPAARRPRRAETPGS